MRLLLLSCSLSKRRFPIRPIPALDRYTGVMFMVFKKWKREQPRAAGVNLLIVSAEFGLLRSDTHIPYYDRRMTSDQAASLAIRIQSSLKREIEGAKHTRSLVNLGRHYLRVLDGFRELPEAEWVTGPIGVRAQRLKAWLNETTE